MDPVKSTHFYETFRTAEDLWVNAYNPTILNIFQSNMDIQLNGSKYGAAAYVCAYINKSEPMGLRQAIADAFASMKQIQPISQKLFSLGNIILTHRELSAQEVAYITFGLPLVQ